MAKNKASERAKGGPARKPKITEKAHFNFLSETTNTYAVTVSTNKDQSCLTVYHRDNLFFSPLLGSRQIFNINSTHLQCHSSDSEETTELAHYHSHFGLPTQEPKSVREALSHFGKNSYTHLFSEDKKDQIMEHYRKYVELRDKNFLPNNTYFATDIPSYQAISEKSAHLPTAAQHSECMIQTNTHCSFNATANEWNKASDSTNTTPLLFAVSVFACSLFNRCLRKKNHATTSSVPEKTKCS
jgi:hypothetical protein